MLRALAFLSASLILVGCEAREDVKACSVGSDKISRAALDRVRGDPVARAGEATAVASRCIERNADTLAYLNEPADVVARAVIFECKNDIAAAKPSLNALVAWQVQHPNSVMPPTGEDYTRDDAEYLAGMREQAVTNVVEARNHKCRAAHNISSVGTRQGVMTSPTDPSTATMIWLQDGYAP